MSNNRAPSYWSGKTFDDFLFRPQKGVSSSRKKISLKSRLINSLDIELPIVSSNMDSVTSAVMARKMALYGGIGVIHRAMTIENQAKEITNVKRSQSAVIENPLRLSVDTTISQVKNFARKKNVTGILIETEKGSGVLAGLLTARDIPWNDDCDDDLVSDYMTPFDRLITEKPGISTDEAAKVLFENRIERLPLISSNRKIHGLITRKDIFSLRDRPNASKDEKGHLLVAAAIGAHGDFLERASALLDSGADCLFIDIAHGHSCVMETAVEEIRKRFNDVPLICGNVATFEGAKFMKDIGVDAIKVGVGPGRGCRTRLETAAGVPQLQAIREAYDAVGDSVPIMADGGIRTDKDIFLALICGASTVMLGSVLSGTDEAPGRIIDDPVTNTKKKIYRGMTSPQAVLNSLYDAEDDGISEALDTPSEGQEIQMAYKGSVVDILHRIRGHLQSSVSYAGELSLEATRKKVLSNPEDYLISLSESARKESFDR